MIVPLWIIAGCQIVLVALVFCAVKRLRQSPEMTREINKLTSTLDVETSAFERARQQQSK